MAKGKTKAKAGAKPKATKPETPKTFGSMGAVNKITGTLGRIIEQTPPRKCIECEFEFPANLTTCMYDFMSFRMQVGPNDCQYAPGLDCVGRGMKTASKRGNPTKVTLAFRDTPEVMAFLHSEIALANERRLTVFRTQLELPDCGVEDDEDDLPGMEDVEDGDDDPETE